MGIDSENYLFTTDELHRHAEELLQSKTVELHTPRTNEEMQRLVHELEVHNIELEAQNAELRQARNQGEKVNRSLEVLIAKAVDELRQKDQMLILQDRLAIMGEMINNIAHQWRQPLNTLGLIIQNLLMFYDTVEFNREFLEENTGKSMELIQHMSRTIDDFRNFFRSDKKKLTFNINQVITLTLSIIGLGFQNQNISGSSLSGVGRPVSA